MTRVILFHLKSFLPSFVHVTWLTLFSGPGGWRRRLGRSVPGKEGSAASEPYRRATKRRKKRSPESAETNNHISSRLSCCFFFFSPLVDIESITLYLTVTDRVAYKCALKQHGLTHTLCFLTFESAFVFSCILLIKKKPKHEMLIHSKTLILWIIIKVLQPLKNSTKKKEKEREPQSRKRIVNQLGATAILEFRIKNNRWNEMFSLCFFILVYIFFLLKTHRGAGRCGIDTSSIDAVFTGRMIATRSIVK